MNTLSQNNLRLLAFTLIIMVAAPSPATENENEYQKNLIKIFGGSTAVLAFMVPMAYLFGSLKKSAEYHGDAHTLIESTKQLAEILEKDAAIIECKNYQKILQNIPREKHSDRCAFHIFQNNFVNRLSSLHKNLSSLKTSVCSWQTHPELIHLVQPAEEAIKVAENTLASIHMAEQYIKKEQNALKLMGILEALPGSKREYFNHFLGSKAEYPVINACQRIAEDITLLSQAVTLNDIPYWLKNRGEEKIKQLKTIETNLMDSYQKQLEDFYKNKIEGLKKNVLELDNKVGKMKLRSSLDKLSALTQEQQISTLKRRVEELENELAAIRGKGVSPSAQNLKDEEILRKRIEELKNTITYMGTQMANPPCNPSHPTFVDQMVNLAKSAPKMASSYGFGGSAGR